MGVCITGSLAVERLEQWRRLEEALRRAWDQNARLRERNRELVDALRERRVESPRRVVRRSAAGDTPYDLAVQQAERRGKSWGLSREDYESMVARVCHYCGGGLGERGVRLDRLDNGRGYELDNVVPCCHRCNMTRNRLLTVSQMEAVGKVLADLERGA